VERLDRAGVPHISPLNLDPERPPFPISYPPGYSGELSRAIGRFHTRGMPFDTQAFNDGVLSEEDFLAQWHFVFAEHERMLARELSRLDSGLLIAYFDAADVAQHTFWRALDPEHPAYSPQLAEHYGEVIPRCYERMDGLVGRTMAAIGEGDTLVVLSDHGFGPFHTAVNLNAVLRDLGYLALREGRRTSGELFEAVDWRRTRAYALGFNSVYLNLAGREGQGCVRAEEAPALTSRLAAALEGFADERTGEHPVRRAYVVRRDCGEDAPDIIVGYRRGYRASWLTALGAVPEETLQPNDRRWSGDHMFDPEEVPGIFLASDPAVDADSIAEVGRAVVRTVRERGGGAR